MSEFERHHYNKFLAYSLIRKEEFTQAPQPDWEWLCHKMALLSINVLRRGKRAEYVE